MQLEARVDATSGSPKMYVQLSWNGGVNWTAAKATATLKKTDTLYTLGTASDTWGRPWSAVELEDTAFRVRITNVATSTARDFSLDRVAVRVTYR